MGHLNGNIVMSLFKKDTILQSIILSTLLGLPLSAAAENTEREGEVKEELTVIEREPEARVPQTFGSSSIRGWYALDSRTMIIETTRGNFKGTFMNNCSGIRFAERIGLDSSGGMALDKYTTVVLPDGQRCFFEELTAYKRDEGETPGEG